MEIQKEFSDLNGFSFELYFGAYLRKQLATKPSVSEPVLHLWRNAFNYFDALEYEIIGQNVFLHRLYEVKSGPSNLHVRKFQRWLENILSKGIRQKDVSGNFRTFTRDQIRVGEKGSTLKEWLKSASAEEKASRFRWVTTKNGHIVIGRDSVNSSLIDLDRVMSDGHPLSSEDAFVAFASLMGTGPIRLEPEFYRRYRQWPPHFQENVELFKTLGLTDDELLELAEKSPLSLLELYPRTRHFLNSPPKGIAPSLVQTLMQDPQLLHPNRKTDLSERVKALSRP